MKDLEDSKELIQSLLQALGETSRRDGYRILRFVLTRTADMAVADVPIQFSGQFAKISYILGERQAPQRLIRSIGSARQRIRHQEQLSDEELNRTFLYDLKSVVAFMQMVFPDAEMPDDLFATLPRGEMTGGWKKAAADCLRIIVTRWDSTHITGRADESDAPEVTVYYGSDNEYMNADSSYLTAMLREGTQLNIVRPRLEKDIYYPELIIYEPDYLIDISSIAAGFREYGVTPLSALINKIAPSSKTSAMLLGDFASQLLDEKLHGGADRTYAESISDFCRTHAVEMAACADLGRQFHVEAKRQKANIHNAIANELPAAVAAFRPEKVVLEPSFTCEMLGIQGRMDFLQTDSHLLIEQKSGKAAFVPGEKALLYPQKTTAHYVQLLLYRALLHYGFNISNEDILPFLLYSKYEHPLLNTESAPELLHRAFRLRNEMVGQELSCYYDGFGILGTLQPSDLNTSGTVSRLWTSYTEPELRALLQPLHDATPVEKAYYMAMMHTVQRELVLSKIGNKRKENSGFAARWHDSLAEKREAGNIIDGMSVEATTTHITCRGMVLGASNFRIGDIVTVYPYRKGTEPDCRKAIVHRAAIETIGSDSIVLRLRVPQTNTEIFAQRAGYLWAMEHDQMDSSFASQFRGIHSFLSASPERRSLVLTQRKPAVDSSAILANDYGEFNDLELRVKRAKELFLVIGPPGTGKTSYGMLNTVIEELAAPEASVAVMAFTNRAVDEVCSKLVEAGIDFVRIGSELSCGDDFKSHLLANRVAEMTKIDEIREYVISQRVVVGTTTAFNSHMAIFALRRFTLAVIDEASQILEPQLLALLSARHGVEDAIGKFVLIGDHKQLPAVVQQTYEESAVSDPLLIDIGLTDCRKSMFERLLSRYRDDEDVVYMLTRQGRMHEDIAAFPNERFYGGMLSCVPLDHQRQPSSSARVEFIHVAPPEESPSDKVNTAEAKAIAGIVQQIDAKMTVGIIVPYRSQISVIWTAIRHIMDSTGGDMQTLEKRIIIDTVERFQGSQRDVIIFGFTVQRRYQMGFLTESSFVDDGKVIDRKLNVVMTRARQYLYMVGNADLLATNELYRTLINRYRIK